MRASASTSVGDTIEYSYCGENTSDLDLEVVRVVDDRFGVLDLPDEPATVLPGETICTGDVGPPVAYVVTAGDAGKTITNNAVVTVRILGDEAQGFQAVDAAEVQVLAGASTTTLAVDDAAAVQEADAAEVQAVTTVSATTIAVDATLATGSSGLPADEAQVEVPAVEASTTIAAAIAPSTTVAAVNPSTTVDGQIPRTGPNGLSGEVLAGLALLLGGSLLVIAVRRRTSH